MSQVLTRKLGKLPPRHDPRTLRFARYVDAQLPPPPASCNWSAKGSADWGQMLNDQIGDCTCAAAGHAIQLWTANHGAEQTPSDAAILTAYEAVSGYDPATGANDNGAVEIDVLNYWRQTGVGGHRIGAYAALHPQSPREVQEAIWLFGGIYIGLALPLAAQQQQVWSAPHFRFPSLPHPSWQPGSWGGHAVFVTDYDQKYLTCVTWGQLQKMTWGWFALYCEEAYGIVAAEWVDGTQPAPNGFDMAALTADLAAIGSSAA
jgi:hypothetical protein